MIPYLFQICGPFYANTYGLAILIAILTFLFLSKKDTVLSKIITPSQMIDLVLLETFVGILGGALLYALTNWNKDALVNMLKVWQGGFSILGTIICVAITLPLYLKFKKIPILTFLDRIAIYAPLVQSIARLGCFGAGCCYGTKTDLPWGIIYKHIDSAAPLFCKIHPTQLYSSLILFIIFILMYYVFQKRASKRGILVALFFILSPAERFFVDFLRDDREFLTHFKLLSINQLIAIGIMLVGFSLLIYYNFNNDKNYKHKT